MARRARPRGGAAILFVSHVGRVDDDHGFVFVFMAGRFRRHSRDDGRGALLYVRVRSRRLLQRRQDQEGAHAGLVPGPRAVLLLHQTVLLLAFTRVRQSLGRFAGAIFTRRHVWVVLEHGE